MLLDLPYDMRYSTIAVPFLRKSQIINVSRYNNSSSKFYLINLFTKTQVIVVMCYDLKSIDIYYCEINNYCNCDSVEILSSVIFNVVKYLLQV